MAKKLFYKVTLPFAQQNLISSLLSLSGSLYQMSGKSLKKGCEVLSQI